MTSCKDGLDDLFCISFVLDFPPYFFSFMVLNHRKRLLLEKNVVFLASLLEGWYVMLNYHLREVSTTSGYS